MKFRDESTLEATEEVTDALDAFNRAYSDVGNPHQKTLVLRGEQERLMAGIVFVIHWHWLHVEILFVQEGSRGQGLGSQLLQQAEVYAKAEGCIGAYLDTLSFQAPDFYVKHGYKVLAKLPNFPPGPNQKIYFAKRL